MQVFQRTVETIVGLLFIILISLVLVKTYHYNQSKRINTYALNANFSNIDGIKVGDNVTLNGVSIGNVASFEILENYLIHVSISVYDTIKIPSDSSAKISSSSFFGPKYIQIIPGDSSSMFKEGDKISYTQPSINLEDFLAKAVLG